MNNECPSSPSGRHSLGGTFATVSYKADFEPTTYGDTAQETLYRRVEYVVSTCMCGFSSKRKVKYIDEG